MLDPGTYSITLRGGIYSSPSDPVGVKAVFGSTVDNLDIIVSPATQTLLP